MARKRGSRSMQHVCGCKLSSVKRRGGGRQPVIKCEGSPMVKFVSKEDAAKLHGTFCAEMLRPIK